MSNGDDVLDNWEEIDEAGLTNTLQKIQAERQTQQDISLTKSSSYSTVASVGNNSHCNNSNNSLSAGSNNFNADFQPMKLLQRTSSTPDTNSTAASALKSPLDDMAAAFEPVMMVLHKTNDEYQSANYTAPINLQTVKILRRPTQSSEPRNNGMRPRQPIKTLQQREQEYAEARLRILGSAKNPEDDVSASNANSTTTTTTATSSSTAVVSTPPINTTAIASTVTTTITAAATKVNSLPKIPIQQQQQQPQQQQLTSGQNVYNNQYHQQQQQQQQQNYYYFQQQQQQQQLLSSPAYNNRTLTTPMSPQQQQQQQIQQQQQLPIQQQQQQQQTWSPVVGGSVSSVTLRQQQQESILRLPRGPDGSTGFQVRR